MDDECKNKSRTPVLGSKIRSAALWLFLRSHEKEKNELTEFALII